MLTKDTMLVWYHGSYWGWHGEYRASPCDCQHCTEAGYSRGWKLVPVHGGEILHCVRDKSVTVLGIRKAN